MAIDAAGAQVQGDRMRQEDSWGIEAFDDGALLALVADGLGGHPAGDLASREGVASFQRAFEAQRGLGGATPKEWLREAMLAAHRELLELQRADPQLYSMATTMIAAYVKDAQLWAACVGDSYLLLLRQDKLYLLNELHTAGGGITSSVGFHLTRVDLADALPLEPGDRLLLASDGLAPLGDEDTARILAAAESAAGGAQDLVNAVIACRAPAQDNATVVVIVPSEEAGPAG